MSENVYLPVLPSLLSMCVVPLSNVLGTRDMDEWDLRLALPSACSHSAARHARALGFVMACCWSDSSHAKATECTKEIRKGQSSLLVQIFRMERI